MYREQAVFEFSLYPVGIGIIGQRKAAHKSTVAAFNAMIFLFLLFLFELAFAGDSEDTIFDGNFYVFPFQLGQLGLDKVFLLIFGNVRQWRPIGQGDFFPPMSIATAKRRTAKEGGETILEVFHFSERLPASECLHMSWFLSVAVVVCFDGFVATQRSVGDSLNIELLRQFAR